MPRDLAIGDGSLLVAFDAQYRLADFHFPHVGWKRRPRRASASASGLQGENLTLDATIDASAFATFYFGAFAPTSAMAEGTMHAIRERLWLKTDSGGIARYDGDAYHRISEETDRVPGNPWILCTLWLAEYALRARSQSRSCRRRWISFVGLIRKRRDRSFFRSR